jgi:rhamnosyltransferase
VDDLNLINPITAIVVSYEPNLANLNSLLHSLNGQAEKIVLIDNHSSNNLESVISKFSPKIHFVRLDKNEGIAKAQNIGIRLSKELGAKYVAFFDQDSCPSSDMLPKLLGAIQYLQNNSIPVACVGPNLRDPRLNLKNSPSVDSSKHVFKFKRVQTIISSGSLAPIHVLDLVGEMLDELFIDYVDLEWCWRAISFGLYPYIIENIVMDHNLGDQPYSFLNHYYPMRTPLRHYYMTRNATYIYQKKYILIKYRALDFIKLIRKIVFYSFFARPRTEHIRMMMLGIYHGLIGKMGRYKPVNSQD